MKVFTFSQFVNESRDSLDFNKPFYVIRVGGSIGEKGKNLYRHRRIVGVVTSTYDSKDEAQESAKYSNKQLSPGEKKYYGIKYKVVPGDSSKVENR